MDQVPAMNCKIIVRSPSCVLCDISENDDMYERDDSISEKSNILGDHASWPYIYNAFPFTAKTVIM